MPQDLFSDRELSVIIWLAIVALYFIYHLSKNENLRSSGFNLLKAVFQPKLIASQLLMLGYIIGQIYLLFRFGLWHEGMIGSTILWVIAPSMSLFKNVTDDWKNPKFLRQKLKGLITHTAILEYIIGLKSFPFFAELIITPIFAFVCITLAYVNDKDEFKSLDKVFEQLLVFYSLIALSYSAWFLFASWNFDYLWGFLFALTMSLLFTPFLFIFRIYVIYESVFLRLNSFSKNKKFPKWYARIRCILAFGANTVVLQRWCDHMMRHEIASWADVDDAISIIKASIKREKNPVQVELQDGWSPYTIKDCLSDYDLPTETYDQYCDGEWGASSSYHQFEGGLMQNNMAFYVSGTKTLATKLKLVFNCNNPNQQKAHLKQFRNRAEILCDCALSASLPTSLAAAIANKSNAQIEIMSKDVKVIYDGWPNGNINGGFSISFVIQNPDTADPD